MESDPDMSVERTPKLSGVILTKESGQIIETAEESGSPFTYEAQLAVLDEHGEPYGDVDALLIERLPENLKITSDDGRSSEEIMIEAIEWASNQGLKSIAISTDELEEIEEVKAAIIQTLTADTNIVKIGFFYPSQNKSGH